MGRLRGDLDLTNAYGLDSDEELSEFLREQRSEGEDNRLYVVFEVARVVAPNAMSNEQNQTADGGPLQRGVRRLLALAHAHEWRGSAWNPFCVEMEQLCRCGSRRHILGLTFSDEAWIDGPHPIAEQLRGSGKCKTEEWTGAW